MELGGSIADPWIVLGNFNALLSVYDKVGGLSVTNFELQGLESLVHSCNLVDLQSIGSKLTWTNGLVSSKLDRVLVNSQWLMANFHRYADFSPSDCLSDHSCVVSLLNKSQCVKKPFKFYNMWTLHEHFQELVAESWTEIADSTARFILKEKLVRLKGKLG